MTIQISKEELEKIGESSVAIADGSEYIAEMTAYHELHCVVSEPVYADHLLLRLEETDPAISTPGSSLSQHD